MSQSRRDFIRTALLAPFVAKLAPKALGFYDFPTPGRAGPIKSNELFRVKFRPLRQPLYDAADFGGTAEPYVLFIGSKRPTFMARLSDIPEGPGFFERIRLRVREAFRRVS